MTALPAPAFADRRAVALGLLLVLALRLIHLRYAVAGPLTWQLGADEHFYYTFGQDVLSGRGGMTELFAFMDPLYGYMVGAILALGAGAFPMYLVQIAADVGTAYGLYRIACELGAPRAGLLAMLVYAVTGTAIAYTAALLKATWVAGYLVWWSYFALRLLRPGGHARWAAFGMFCGIGIALRANLLLLLPAWAVVTAWLLRARRPPWRALTVSATWMAAGLALPLALLVARNVAISGKWSPMPNNGGIVLHQLYNPDNPQSRAGAPRFVRHYSGPIDIWTDYAAEARRRHPGAMTPQAVDRYWRGIGTRYVFEHPAQSVGNAVRKLREASAYPEVPNTRNYVDERIVSPLLRALPLPFGWLFALGLPGLILAIARDRRALLVAVPLAVGAVTIAVFFAEDRFRFNVIGGFVFGTAVWMEAAWRWIVERRWSHVIAAVAISALLGTWSVVQARLLLPDFPSDWQRLAWGYLKSGQPREAHRLIDHAVRAGTPGAHELLGYLFLQDRRWREAAAAYEIALRQRDDKHTLWHNYGIALQRIGRSDASLHAARTALRLDPGNAAYRRRVEELSSVPQSGETSPLE